MLIVERLYANRPYRAEQAFDKTARLAYILPIFTIGTGAIHG
jgi:hypothetical protein